MRKIITLLLLLCCLASYLPTCEACTSVLISGKITPDGRPLLFKHRDASSGTYNLPRIVQGERYRYLALFNAADRMMKSAWGGHNETGFAIINTAAYNLNGPDGNDSNGDGALMKRALEICATLKDFETLLDTLPRPRDLNSNFGVIDAQGGCAYYETGNERYVKFDVNDSQVAPKGYLMRTNFGFTGADNLRTGAERYAAITELMGKAEKEGNINCGYMITHISRYLKHGLTHVNLYDIMPEDESQSMMYPFRDFIPRYTSTATMLIQGVLPTEPTTNTVCWMIAGYPLTTVAMPLMLLPSGKLPEILKPTDNNCSWLCNKSVELKNRLFEGNISHNKDYINLGKLINKQGTGILQRTLTIEEEVIQRGIKAVDKMRSKQKEQILKDYYNWVDQYLYKAYASYSI
ncbi:MAG: acyl-CoA--6-aminopenicillanic acid acyl-transferase [Prevotella sp.]|nr:acyl-CoA--6-aminopenicillanic acid acyl-transferase [Prevotella sp.]MBQ9223164.1 acyl-CoA--6-aminopenicillanic acid acyl-transferase [Prevotella sp.]